MGVVYKVLDQATGELRALKRLHREGAREKALVEAFEREYHVLAGLDHPRIIRVFDYGIDDEGPYYTMELVEGSDLRALAPLPYRKACHYLRDVATSLALLHARKLIHRDVSPRNVRVTADDHGKLLDFGALSTFGRTSVVVGTPPAIPPESLEGAPLDQRADLFSLGALAYWLLTGHHAFPARQLDELPEAWLVPPRPPSLYAADVPTALDALVLSLLQRDPRARPASAAEVIARLNVAGDLSPEDTSDADRLADSFLLQPRFTGRVRELAELEVALSRALRGRGNAVRIRGIPGMGRTRLLEELGVRAQLSGATALRVDATMYRQVHGCTRALVLQLLEALPDAARAATPRFRHVLGGLGPDVERRLGLSRSPSVRPSSPAPGEEASSRPLEAFFIDVSRASPLVLLIDNIDEADHGSLGVLAAVAKLATKERVLVVATESPSRKDQRNLGNVALQAHSSTIELVGLDASETLELSRSLFGDAPNVERFADWLHERTAGSPLHAVELCRQLVAKQVIRYSGGLWTLPADRPDADLPTALEEALSIRIDALGESARSLAECISLQREQPSFELCRLLCASVDERQVLSLLDELARNDVLHHEVDGYRFSSIAIREALLRRMDDMRQEQNHRSLGEAFAAMATDDNPALRIQAGFHLVRGGRESEGADLIASVACDSAAIRTLMANLERVGEPLEAALLVYRAQRRTPYETMPILAALAQAGYYEEYQWGTRYGDEALSVLENLSGIATARRLRRFCGRFPSLIFGILFAWARYVITPRAERQYPFPEIIVCLLSTATTLSGIASLSLDPERATRVVDAVEPFSVLPERLTPVGIYQFCRALQEIGRENQATALKDVDKLLTRFADPRYYPTLPDDARTLYLAAAHFARATFGIFRADGGRVLESADALDRTGLLLYSMIASQLRFLFRMNRGEFAQAEEHRKEVELHAVQVGSIWQVENWEQPALILVYTSLSDVVSATRVAHRLEALSRSVPALKLHSRLAKHALERVRGDDDFRSHAAEYHVHAPRSFIGWAATFGFLAQAYNDRGRHTDALSVAEETLSHVTDEDRAFTSLFLNLDIQRALAIAGLGEPDRALAIIDGLLRRFDGCDHPLTMGLLYDARARIAWNAGRVEDYETSLRATESYFRPTGTPLLMARCERLAHLRTAALLRTVVPPSRNPEAPTIAESVSEETVHVVPVLPGFGARRT
jgi:serine/threonine-protein kinase